VQNIALVAIVAFVIVILAFFFSAPIRGLNNYDGAPHGYERSRETYLSQRSERLNAPTRTPYQLPTDVRESGLSEGRDTN
jgi:hypothetical protein